MLYHTWVAIALCGFVAVNGYSIKSYGGGMSSEISNSYSASQVMSDMLDIKKFFELSSDLLTIIKALDPKHGLAHDAAICKKQLHELWEQVEFFSQISAQLANPCVEGIFWEGQCYNFIKESDYQGTPAEAENECHGHFGTFTTKIIAATTTHSGETVGPTTYYVCKIPPSVNFPTSVTYTDEDEDDDNTIDEDESPPKPDWFSGAVNPYASSDSGEEGGSSHEDHSPHGDNSPPASG